MTLNIDGRLLDFSTPQVMGIINVTPDSFYASSRTTHASVLSVAESMIASGATILDIGACSTRPESCPVSADEELRRLDAALTALSPLRTTHPDILISLDTFRAAVASHGVREHGIHIVNDVSAGSLDPLMFETVADLHVPYVLTHSGGLPATPAPTAPSPVATPATFLPSVARFFADRLQQLYALGVSDVLLDPGFGFGKTVEQNFTLLRHLGDLIHLFPEHPFLIGLSRKSMICRTLDITPDAALNGTTVLHTIALQAGAHILRVHDVSPATESIRLLTALNGS